MNYNFCKCFHNFLFNTRLPILFERRFIYKDNRPRKPRHGKFHGYAIKQVNADHFRLALKRGFTRTLMSEFGLESGIEKTKLLIESRGQNVFRRLDDKKKKQLISIYSEQLASIFAMDESISKCNVIITKVELPTVFNEIIIYWECFGDERDKEIAQLLESSAVTIAKKMTDYLFTGSVLRLKFIPDRIRLRNKENLY